MKTLEKENILQYEVENFVHLIVQKTETFQSLKNKVHHFSLTEEDNAKVIKRIEFANRRILKPLSNSKTFMFILFPFGIVTKLAGNNLFDVEEQKRLGYYTRVKEFYIYSFVGVAFYSMIVLMVVFIQ
tara:strand:+ start:6436 stop:6819 length:384 start_codon:yes stop_codon:yes gene_type:complete